MRRIVHVLLAVSVCTLLAEGSDVSGDERLRQMYERLAEAPQEERPVIREEIREYLQSRKHEERMKQLRELREKRHESTDAETSREDMIQQSGGFGPAGFGSSAGGGRMGGGHR